MLEAPLIIDLPFATTPPDPLAVLVLPMRPKAKARPRFVGPGIAHDTPEDKKWRKTAIGYAKARLPYQLTFDFPLRLDLFAIYERNEDQEKDRGLPDGFLFCPQFGDRDNIAGSVMDALGSPAKRAKAGQCLWGSLGLWEDDDLIVCGEPIKLRAERGGESRVVLFVSRAWIPRLLLDRLAALSR